MASATAKSRAARARSRRSRRRSRTGRKAAGSGRSSSGVKPRRAVRARKVANRPWRSLGHGAVAPLQPGDQGVGLGDQVEQHGQGGGDVQVVVQGRLEPVAPAGRGRGAQPALGLRPFNRPALRPTRRQAWDAEGAGGVGGEGGQAVVAGGGVGEDLLGELQGTAVVGAEEGVAQDHAAVAGQELAGADHVADGLGHLLALELQEGVVEPVAGERLAGGGLGLGDLVLVVREDEVLAAPVDVEGAAQVLAGHGRALDVPAGAARSPG